MIPQVISVVDFWNVSARSSAVRDTVKKSKESQDQARNETRKKAHCCLFSMARSLKGFATLAMGGFREVSLVTAYLRIETLSGNTSPCW